ncbi:Uncharacterized protein APZ42_019990 [Daphnia magna]|uniref:Uncharacterized protein n=1 Tax=Daphnia magna TaxID=35525 RepID=A0A164XV90_9CRUS|nr:Uncharacterized protein APZ42_019990 [Daphnia magna]
MQTLSDCLRDNIPCRHIQGCHGSGLSFYY